MVAVVEPLKRAPRAERTQMDTIELTAEQVSKWKSPPFQRPVRVNEKVMGVAEDLKRDRVMPGIITLGLIEQGLDRGTYLLDGQHRIKAFELAQVNAVLADIRILTFANLADAGEAFVELNSSLVAMRPDDILRGMEGSIAALRMIRDRCPFVGYDQVRRGGSRAPICGMSQLLRCWHGSTGDTPGTMSVSALRLARETTPEMAEKLSGFLEIAMTAWGRDPEYYRLWSSLNLTLVMWMYRRLVLETERGVKRYVVLKPDEFSRCLMSVSASGDYIDWLLGRNMGERDRAPAYQRLKEIFTKRLSSERPNKVLMPMPAWDTRGGSQKRR